MQAIRSQPVASRLTRAAIFLVVGLDEDADGESVRSLCGDLSSLVRAVGFRDLDGALSCVMGISSTGWDRLFRGPKPAELHPFRELRGKHHAVSTPGDVLFHIRAARMDMCFALAAEIRDRLGPSVSVIDEVHGFKYFDDRDLIGFVDGTENPEGPAASDATIIGDEDPAFRGGSYVIVQKYLHDLAAWDQLPVERQEAIIGRRKLSDIELADAVKAPYAHNVLTSITENGKQVQILRDNMPFGNIGEGEFGTYFIGYAKSPKTIEQMLRNMFIGLPEGNYDRLLDFSRAVTGSLFFVPSADFLDDAPPAPPSPETARRPEAPEPDGATSDDAASADESLGIGSLRKRETR
ncbi:MAG: peroxidase [Leifsonia xyli]|nr:MAG: peroxidase [Leifsonia xyli]